MLASSCDVRGLIAAGHVRASGGALDGGAVSCKGLGGQGCDQPRSRGGAKSMWVSTSAQES